MPSPDPSPSPVSLSGGRWRLWSQFALRGPGFPASGVRALAPEGLAVAADKAARAGELSGPDWAEFEEEFARAAVATAERLQEIAASPLFQAAVAWQNPAVLRTGIGPFLAWTPTTAGRTSMPRQREELVAHYWQRFCVKNDTIGFFGPVGWGTIDPAAPGLEVSAGEGLTEQSSVYFSSWAVDTLAKAVSADPALREWTAPRRVPFVRPGDGVVAVPGRPPQPATPLELLVLARCDGARTAADLRAEVPPDADLAALLDAMAAKRWITWKLELPAGTHPERDLRAWLASVGDPAARERGLAVLDLVERHRDEVGAAVGADALTDALARLEAAFTEATGSAAARTRGANTAPGRALVYADARRSAGARLGGDVLAALAPMRHLLTSATWLTAELARRVMARAGGVHARLGGGGPVDLASFWFACLPVLHGAAAEDAAEVQREFQRRWAKILGSDLTASGERVAAGVRELFGDPAPGWTAARYLSPDVMIAAEDAAAVARGEYTAVLGELHLASNTLGASLFVHQHPDPARLLAQTTADHPGPRLLPLLPKEHKARLSARVRYALARPEDHHVGLLDYTADPRRSRTHMSADLTVHDRGGRLVVELPDGEEFPAVDVFSHVLTTLVMDLFHILPDDLPHSPRVLVDNLVVARETWRFTGADLDFATARTEAARFALARRWRTGRALPRFVFAACPTEPRPFFVDFDSPVSVSVLAKAARRLTRAGTGAAMTVTEMLPTPQQCWLNDDVGRRYTSELRFVAVHDG